MIKTIIFFLVNIIALILSIIIGPITIFFLSIFKKEEQKKKLIFKISSLWARLFLKVTFCKIDVKGIENIPKDRAVLFVSNHQSNFDIPLLMAKLNVPLGFIAKKELASWPIISYWMKKMRCIFMDRSNVRKSAEAIVEGINILKSDYSMVVFPEGTRSKGIQRHEFKGGSFKLATKSKVPIVPITIEGTYKILSGPLNTIKRNTTINLTIHPLIEVKDLSKEQLQTLPEDVEKIVFSELDNK